jgi:hypothetical protein
MATAKKQKTETEPKNGMELAAYTPREPSPLASLTDEQWDLTKRIMAPGATNDEFLMFRHWCEEQGYDPLRKQAYFTIQKSKCPVCKGEGPPNCSGGCVRGYLRVPTFIASIDGLIARAARDPNFIAVDGAAVYDKDDFLFDALTNQPVKHTFGGLRGNLQGAWARVRRRDGEMIAFYYPKAEYSGGPVAGSKPGMMLLKSAQAIVLRRTYPEKNPNTYIPEEFGGYIEESGALMLPASSPVQPAVPQLEAPKDENPWEAVAEQVKEFEKRPLPVVEEIPKEQKTAPAGTPASIPPTAASEPQAEPQPPAQPVHKTTEGQVIAEDGTFTEGVLTYKMFNEVKKVRLTSKGKSSWVPATEPLTKFLTPQQLTKLVNALRAETFGNDFEYTGHLKKHFKKGTAPSLTGQELAALMVHKELGLHDPRWYADKLPAQQPTPQPIDTDDGSQDDLAAAYGITDPSDPQAATFLDAISKLPDPLWLKTLLWPRGRTWAKDAEELVGLAQGLVDSLFSPDDVDQMTASDAN